MSTFPFRPPQFSDDVAWLPAWAQSSQVATPFNEDQSLQHMDASNGDTNNIKDCIRLSNVESGYKICRLYLSREENSPANLTPSSQKVVHFNLHLSTDGISSIVSTSLLDISQNDTLNSEMDKPMQICEALVGRRETSQSNMNHSSSAIELQPSPSNGNDSGYIGSQTQYKSINAKQNALEIFNSKGSDSDSIDDAVELSVAASEALVIHELVQSGSISEALSTAAIIEVALRVKQARLEELKDSVCCSIDNDCTIDVLSDMSESELEDAYQDVGLSVSSLDNANLKDTSISRVRDTPMSELHPGHENEIQSEWKRDEEIDFNNSNATEPLGSYLNTNASKSMSTDIFDSEEPEKLCRNPSSDIFGTACELQPGDLDDLQIRQGDNRDIESSNWFPHQLEVKSSLKDLHSGKAIEHLTPAMWYSDMDKVNDKSSCRFQSRWFGGWTGKVGDACAGIESKGTKVIRKLFIDETSYLSESADVAPDQNSYVHNHPHCSRASESNLPLENSVGAANERGVYQNIVEDSPSSLIDPLCSIVPCSISVEKERSSLGADSNDNLRVLDLTANLKIPLEDVHTSSRHNDESVREKGNDQLAANASCPNTIFRRQLTSLRPYSTGLPGKLSDRSFNCGLESPEEHNTSFLSNKQERSSNSSPNEKDLREPPPVKSASNTGTTKADNHETLLLLEQQRSGVNTSDGKCPVGPFRSMFSSKDITNNEETQEASGRGNASKRSIQDFIERNADNVAEQVHLQDMPLSPRVLGCRTRRRFKAPKCHVIDFGTANQVPEQAPGSDVVSLNCKEIAQDQKECLDSGVPARKRVRFSEDDVKFHPEKNLKKVLHSSKIRSSCRIRDRTEQFDQGQGTASQEVKERLTNCRIKGRKRIFQGLEFLLTGFSKKKEKELELLLRKHDGMVLSDIPSPPPYPRGRRSLRVDAQRLPVILCTKKLQTTKFLYGCAVNAFLLKVGWAYDSIRAGSVLPPDKYVVLVNQTHRKLTQIGKSVRQDDDDYIFDRVGIMLHGRHSFCSKFIGVIKHGRGYVFKSLQRLVESLQSKKIMVGAIVAEDENRATRHLKKCASEQKIPVMPASWILRSLVEGKLLPFEDKYHSSNMPAAKVPKISVLQGWSEEI